jgi:DNA polymerase-3 subunit delta'
MNNLALHPSTKNQLDKIVLNPPHGILIVGPTGIGKFTIAIALAENLLGIDNFESYPYGIVIKPLDSKTISIDVVRELQHFLSLKVIGNKIPNRVVIIENAQTLTIEAQNALLKTLEEPPVGTILILTVNYEQNLLPTIRSRVQAINVSKPSETVLKDKYIDVNDSLFQKAYALSGGSPGLLHALIYEEDHPLLEATKIAREILSKSSYERLLLVDDLSKKRDTVNNILIILQQMAHFSLSSTNSKVSPKWERILSASYDAAEALSSNGQVKLVLTNLMLNI